MNSEKPAVICIKAHPDDLAGMAGAAWKLKDRYALHIVCLTRGERGLKGKSPEETAAIRTREEEAACALLGARLYFAGGMDGDLFADRALCESVAEIVARVRPTALFAQWPIDHHRDHTAASEIARKAALLSGTNPEILFWESNPEGQSAQFEPDFYVDISDVIEKKLEIRRAHVCQNVDDEAGQRWRRIAAFRGVLAGCRWAEGFKRLRPVTANADRGLLFTL